MTPSAAGVSQKTVVTSRSVLPESARAGGGKTFGQDAAPLAPLAYLSPATNSLASTRRGCNSLECGDLSPLSLSGRFAVARAIDREKRSEKEKQSDHKSSHSKPIPSQPRSPPARARGPVEVRRAMVVAGHAADQRSRRMAAAGPNFRPWQYPRRDPVRGTRRQSRASARPHGRRPRARATGRESCR